MKIFRREMVASGPGRRQRKGVVLLLWLGALLLPAVVLLGGGGGGAVSALAATLADPLSVFAARSPGARDAGALSQTKKARARHAPSAVELAMLKPQERVLATVRSRPPADIDVAPFVPDDAPAAAPAPVDTLQPLGTAQRAPSVFAGPVPGAGGGGGGGPIGAPGGGQLVPVDGGGTDRPGPAPLPEPASWALLIAGFAMVGLALRRRAVVSASSGAVAPDFRTRSFIGRTGERAGTRNGRA